MDPVPLRFFSQAYEGKVCEMQMKRKLKKERRSIALFSIFCCSQAVGVNCFPLKLLFGG